MLSATLQRRRFSDLSEQEILALAISNEEDDARIYRQYAEHLREEFPSSAKVFDGMAAEEDEHRRLLIEAHQARFGDVIPLIRREHVAGFYARRPIWLVENLGLETIRGEAARWNDRQSSSIARPPTLRRMQTHASFWAIWPRPRPITPMPPLIWKPSIWTKLRARVKTRPPIVSSS